MKKSLNVLRKEKSRVEDKKAEWMKICGKNSLGSLAECCPRANEVFLGGDGETGEAGHWSGVEHLKKLFYAHSGLITSVMGS